MASTMIEANTKVFSMLERHCARRKQPIPTAGLARYVYGDSQARSSLKKLRTERMVKFGFHRSLVHLKKDEHHYLALIGFDIEPDLPQLLAGPHDPGFTVSVLCAAEPQPIASPF